MTNKNQGTLDRVIKIACDHLAVPEDTNGVQDGTASFVNDLGADSLDTVELVMAFEEEFGCEVTDDEADAVDTINDAVELIVSKFK